MKRNFLAFLLLSGILWVSSCQQMFEVTPRNQLARKFILNDITTTQGILNSCYARLRDLNYYGRSLILLPELLADNCTLANPAARSGRGLNEAQNLPGAHMVHWQVCYFNINSCNLILDNVDNIPNTTAAIPLQKNAIKAQAHFLRALAYFDLIRTYAYNPNYVQNGFDLGVPIVLKGVDDYTAIPKPARAKIVDVYKQIEKDLQDAINFAILTGTPDAAFGGAANARFVGTRTAAHALLARVYLYWSGALPSNTALLEAARDNAIIAINNAGLLGANMTNAAGHVSAWTVRPIAGPHQESLFEVNINSLAEANAAGINSDGSLQGWYNRHLLPSGATVGWGDVIASPDLVNFLTANLTDVRHNDALLAPTQAGARVGEPATTRETRKYSVPVPPTAARPFGLINIPIIRLAEMHLILAEARALLGDGVNASTSLNTVRTNRGLAASTSSGPALLQEIYDERRREFAFEGHRWFDFTRRGLGVRKPDGSIIPFSDFRILPPIPLVDIQSNKNLVQNPGY
ncbi:MAG: RagB/SusD family nutrient uptake outer membrane protein [Microscillaceae bacterium]|nr:RagB/SusD family nutrient uptake outer membrane protein [Microscillaceae bacterium]MDW8461708.1 RagB/SusD family nutrient uptake outer membrane protein [Cytophagales bacterium]